MSNHWGKTGRVMLAQHDEELIVFSDFRRAGEVTRVKYGESRGKWFGAVGSMSTPARQFAWSPDLPSLDAAVMWVLRGAAPDVWREERGPVWQVTRCYGDEFARPGWDALRPDEGIPLHYRTHADAIKAATS